MLSRGGGGGGGRWTWWARQAAGSFLFLYTSSESRRRQYIHRQHLLLYRIARIKSPPHPFKRTVYCDPHSLESVVTFPPLLQSLKRQWLTQNVDYQKDYLSACMTLQLLLLLQICSHFKPSLSHKNVNKLSFSPTYSAVRWVRKT